MSPRGLLRADREARPDLQSGTLTAVNSISRGRRAGGGDSCELILVNARSTGLCRAHLGDQDPPMKRAVHASDERSKLRPVEKAALPINSRVRAATRTALVILLVVLALWVASDFLSALAWAAIIAITTWPIYTRFASRIARGRAPALAALLFTLLTGLALLVPVILTVHQLTQGSEGFARWVTQLRAEGLPVPGSVAQLPIAGEYLDRWWQTNLSNPKAMVEWLRGMNIESITAWTSALGGALLHRLFLFLVTMIALFLVLRDGAWLAGRVLATTDLLLGRSW